MFTIQSLTCQPLDIEERKEDMVVSRVIIQSKEEDYCNNSKRSFTPKIFLHLQYLERNTKSLLGSDPYKEGDNWMITLFLTKNLKKILGPPPLLRSLR